MTKKNFLITLAIIFLVLILDQASKLLIENHLATGELLTVIPNFFYITKVYNTGAAWGMGSNSTLLLLMISILASFVALWFCTKNDFKTKKIYSISLCLIMSGAFGNLYDRLFTILDLRKGVIDFFEFHFGSYVFPVFNIADMALVIGVILLAVDIIFFEEKRKNNAKNV